MVLTASVCEKLACMSQMTSIIIGGYSALTERLQVIIALGHCNLEIFDR
jgi:hypothetical protein